MRFVGVKRPEQQSVMVLHGHTEAHPALDAVRGHMAGFGLVAQIGREGMISRAERLGTASLLTPPPQRRGAQSKSAAIAALALSPRVLPLAAPFAASSA